MRVLPSARSFENALRRLQWPISTRCERMAVAREGGFIAMSRRFTMKRRTFLGLTTLAFPAILSAQSPARKVRIAVIGMGGRGTSHAVTLAKLPGVEVEVQQAATN